MDENTLKQSLELYKSQLSQVEQTLQAAGETADLLQLRDEMKQLISLTEDGLVSLMKSKMLTEIDGGQTASHSAGRSSHLEDEYAAFQASIGGGDEKSDEGAQDISSTSQSIVDQLQNIVGMKCRAPFLHEWGSKGYFNAIVTGVEETQSSDEVPKVTVMYCNPTSTKMLPCSFHLEGRCNFDREWCKYSHGNVVDVEDLKEFKEPNYNYLQMGMPCLVRYDDDLWYRAKVVDILDDHKFTVNFDNYNDTRTVDLEEILPLDASNNESDENSDDDDDDDYADRNQPIDRGPDEEGEELPVYLWKPPKTNEALGSWEAHTRESSEFRLPETPQFYGNPHGSASVQNTEGMSSSHLHFDASSRPSVAHHQNVKIPDFIQDDHMMQTSTYAIGNQIGRRPALLPTPDMTVASGTNDTKSQNPSPQSARAASQLGRIASHTSNDGNSATYSKDRYGYGAPTVLPTPKLNVTDGFSNPKSQNSSPHLARTTSHASNNIANNSKDQYRYGQPTVLPTPKMNVTDVSSNTKSQNPSPQTARATSHASNNGKNATNSKDQYRYSAPTALPESARVWINPNLQKQAPKPASIHESIWKKYSRKRKSGPFDVTNPLKRKIPESGQGNDTSDTQNSDKSFEENPDADVQDSSVPKKKRRRPKNPYSRGLHSKWTPKTASKFQSCPFPTCNIQSRRMKWHVGIEHLNPAFDRIDAYQNPRHHIARRDGLEWLAKKILGPKASISDLVPLLNRSNIIHNNSVLSDKDIANMESMCRAMNWERPPAFTLHPINSPSVLLFWRCLLNLAMMLKPEDHQLFMKETTTNLLKQYYSENSTAEAKDVANRPVSVEQKANTTSSHPNIALLGRNDINSRLENIRKLIAQHADVDKVQIPNFKNIGAVGEQKTPEFKSSTTLGPRKAPDFQSPATSGYQTLPDVKRSVPVGYQRTSNFQSVASSGNHTMHGNKSNLASDSPKTPSIQSITTSNKHTLPDIQRNEAVGRQRAPNFQSVESQGNKRTDVRRNVAVSNQMTTDFQRVPSLDKQRASDFQSIAALENRKATDSNTISTFGNNKGTPDFQSISASGIKKTPDSTSSDIFRSNQQTHDSMHFAAFSSNQQSPYTRSFAAFGSNQEAPDFQSIAALSNKMSPSSTSSAAFSGNQESPDSMSFTAFGSNQQSPDSQNIQLFSNQPTTDAKNIQQFSRHEQAYAFMRRVQALNRNQRAPGPKKNAALNSNQQMSDFNKGVALNSIQPSPEFKRVEPLISLQQSPDLMRSSALRENQEISTFERIAASNSTQQSPDFKSIAVSSNQQTSDFKSAAAQSNQNSEVSSTQGPPEEMMSSLGGWRDGSDSKKTASGHQKAAAASMSSILLENVDCVFDSYLNVEEMCQILYKRKSWSFGRQPLKTIFKTRIMREIEPKHAVAVVGGVMIFDDPSCYPKKSHVDPTWNVAFGVHPKHAPFLTEEQLSRLAKILQGREIRALGTIGFDYTEQKTYWDFQEEVFVNLLGLSEPDRPIIIHVKGVEGDVLGSSVHKKCFTKVKEKCPKQQKIQLHSFSGTPEDVGMWTTEFSNCYFSFTWNVEFFNEIQKSAIRSVPHDKILIETGILDQSVSLPRTAIKRPTQLGDLASLIAEIRGEKFDEFLKQTVENGQRLHGTRIVKKKSR